MQLIKMIVALTPFLVGSTQIEQTASKGEFVINYGIVQANELKDYEIAILEPFHYNKDQVAELKKSEAKLFGYLSLTEVNKNSSSFSQLEGYCKEQNTNWNSCLLDIEIPKVQVFMIARAKQILEKGFDGLFIDNLDNTNQWGFLKSKNKSLEQLIVKLKTDIGAVPMIQNAGLHLSDFVQNKFDYLLMESIVTGYDFKHKRYDLRSLPDLEYRKKMVQEAQKTNPKKLLILEYANTVEMRLEVRKRLGQLAPFVYCAEIDLQTITKP